jgi:uncharacterized protein (DUF2062 family)
MDDSKPVNTRPKTAYSSLRSSLYTDLPPKGTSLKQRIRMIIFSHDSPRQIALGTAVGVFLGFSPFLGIHTIAALGLAVLFRASRLAAVLGTLVNNPVTMTFLYLFELRLGSRILGFSLTMPDNIWKNFMELFSLGRKAFLSIMIGFFILGTISAIIAYLLTLAAVVYIKRRRARRHRA